MKIHIHITGVSDSDDELMSLAKTIQIDPNNKREEAGEAIRKLMIDNNITMNRLCHSGWFELPNEA